MTEKQLKVLIVAANPEIRGVVQDIFDRHYDLTTVDSIEAAFEKSGQENFDVILTDFVLPRISGADVISNIKPANGIALSQKTEQLKKVREIISRHSKYLEAQKPDTAALLKASQAKHKIILDLIDGQLRELMSKNSQHDLQIQNLAKDLKTALSAKEETAKELEQVRLERDKARKEIKQVQLEKKEALEEIQRVRSEVEKDQRQAEELHSKLAEAEKKAAELFKEKAETLELVETVQEQRAKVLKELEKAMDEKEALRSRIATLEKDLRESVTLAETNLADKARIEKKLAEFQEHWDKYVKVS